MKRILAMVVSVVLVATLAISGSVAYLTSTDEAVNVMTLGEVKIEQWEKEWGKDDEGNDSLVEFTQGKPLYPYVGQMGWDKENGNEYRKFTMNNVVDKYVTVENTGKSEAYVRTIIALEMGKYETIEDFYYNIVGVSYNDVDGREFQFDGKWKWVEGDFFVAKIDGLNYMIMTAVHQDSVKPGETTIPSLLQVYMNKECDNEQVAMVDGNENGWYDILVVSQAVQTAGFDSAEQALNEAFGVLNEKDAQGVYSNLPWNNGEASTTYEAEFITSVKELKAFAEKVNGGETYAGKTVMLGGNINLAGEEWKPINGFKGTFDGNGYTISNLTVKNQNGDKGLGFFATLNGTVKNVKFDNATVEGLSAGAAVVAGQIYPNGLIEKVTVTNSTVNSNHYVAGIAGYVYGNVKNCTVMDTELTATPNEISAAAYDNGDKVGGIVGLLCEGTYEVSGNTVSGVKIKGYRDIGGIAGAAHLAGKTFENNNAKNVTAILDDTLSYSSNASGNAGTVVGRILSGSLSADSGNEGEGAIGKEVEISDQTALNDLATGDTKSAIVTLAEGTYKMPSITGSKEITITGTKDTVIDNTLGSYMESSKISFNGVTIKGSTGYANGNGSDYAALYSPNVTYTECTFDGPFRIGRDGAKFIKCTFTNLGNDYVWTYGNDATFEGCTFESDGKALLIYSDGGSEVSKVKVTGCTFNATQGAKAGAIANQSCAAIEIHNYGNGVDLTTSGNTIDSDFSGEWRIKTYENGRPAIIVNGTEYKTIALDGKTMTMGDGNNVTVNE